MADTQTTNYQLIKPEVGASNDTWGNKSNANWDAVDAAIAAVDAKRMGVPELAELAADDYLPIFDISSSGSPVRRVLWSTISAVATEAANGFLSAADKKYINELPAKLEDLGKFTGTVKYTEQALDDTQKTQARTNIGAASKTSVDTLATAVGEKFDKTGGPVSGNIDAAGYIKADGDLVTQGGLWVGETNVMAELSLKAGFYTGGDSGELNLPIGSTVLCHNSGAGRNAQVVVRLHTGYNNRYTAQGAGAVLSGVWRASGESTYDDRQNYSLLVRRTQ